MMKGVVCEGVNDCTDPHMMHFMELFVTVGWCICTQIGNLCASVVIGSDLSILCTCVWQQSISCNHAHT